MNIGENQRFSPHFSTLCSNQYLHAIDKLINIVSNIKTSYKLFFLNFCFMFVLPCFVLQSSILMTNNNLNKQVKSRKSGNPAAQNNGPVSLDFLRSIPKSKPTNEVSSGTYKYQMRRRLVITNCLHVFLVNFFFKFVFLFVSVLFSPP